MTPLAQATLKSPQLAVAKPAGALGLQALEERFCSCVKLLAKPQKDIRPDAFERILARPPRPRTARTLSVSGTCFASAPETWECGKELIQTLTAGAGGVLRRAERCEGGLRVPDIVE